MSHQKQKWNIQIYLKRKKIESIKEDEFQKNDKPSEEIKSDPGNREEEAPKKGFWSRFFGS